MADQDRPPSPPHRTGPQQPPCPAMIRSEDLLGQQREILIIHAQEVYRLRLTRNGKLILTK